MIKDSNSEFFEMLSEQKRLQSFSSWPHKHPSKCTKEKMAQAGYFFTGSETNDAAKCFVCLKQLEGFEPSDDPWEEHKSHSPGCPFIELYKPEEEMTYSDIRNLDRARVIFITNRELDRLKEKFEKESDEVEQLLCNLSKLKNEKPAIN